jgi:hypothetical protein
MHALYAAHMTPTHGSAKCNVDVLCEKDNHSKLCALHRSVGRWQAGLMGGVLTRNSTRTVNARAHTSQRHSHRPSYPALACHSLRHRFQFWTGGFFARFENERERVMCVEGKGVGRSNLSRLRLACSVLRSVEHGDHLLRHGRHGCVGGGGWRHPQLARPTK